MRRAFSSSSVHLRQSSSLSSARRRASSTPQPARRMASRCQRRFSMRVLMCFATQSIPCDAHIAATLIMYDKQQRQNSPPTAVSNFSAVATAAPATIICVATTIRSLGALATDHRCSCLCISELSGHCCDCCAGRHCARHHLSQLVCHSDSCYRCLCDNICEPGHQDSDHRPVIDALAMSAYCDHRPVIDALAMSSAPATAAAAMSAPPRRSPPPRHLYSHVQQRPSLRS